MTVTYTKQVSRCKECPNVVFEGGAVGEKAKWRCSIRSEEGGWDKLIKQPGTVPSWCPLRPAPGEEWEPASRSMPRIDSDEWDASVRVWTLDDKGHVNEDVYERRGGGRFSYHEGARERFGIKTIIVAWRYRRTPAPPTGE